MSRPQFEDYLDSIGAAWGQVGDYDYAVTLPDPPKPKERLVEPYRQGRVLEDLVVKYGALESAAAHVVDIFYRRDHEGLDKAVDALRQALLVVDPYSGWDSTGRFRTTDLTLLGPES
jgi:hypothetical protein